MHVSRDKDGKIDGAFRWPNDKAQEKLGKDDAELQAFLNPVLTEADAAVRELADTDAEMASIAEEAIDILDGLIKEIDPTKDVKSRFSQQAKDLLARRQAARAKLTG